MYNTDILIFRCAPVFSISVIKKAPEYSEALKRINACRFFHPDYTVGFGISPNQHFRGRGLRHNAHYLRCGLSPPLKQSILNYKRRNYSSSSIPLKSNSRVSPQLGQSIEPSSIRLSSKQIVSPQVGQTHSYSSSSSKSSQQSHSSSQQSP